MIDFKGHRFEPDILLTRVRGYLAYPLSDRNLEERLAERGVDVDHSSVDRWVQKFTPHLEATFRKGQKRPVGNSGRMDETSIKIKGPWKYLDRAVDKEGQTIDFLLTAHRVKKAALRFFKKAVRQHGLPDKVTLDKSGANTAAIEALKEETGHPIEIRQNKYLNNLVEQDHRAVQWIVRPMLGFQSFRSARVTLPGIERMYRIKKGQRIMAERPSLSAANQFYSLAASFRPEMVKLVCQKLTQHHRTERCRAVGAWSHPRQLRLPYQGHTNARQSAWLRAKCEGREFSFRPRADGRCGLRSPRLGK
jgi:transposase-like protein